MTITNAPKAALTELREQLAQRVEAIRRDVAAGRSADSEERATEAENDAPLEEIEQQARDELAWVDHALKKVADGTYGQCDVCGEPIAEARLSAVPYATTCMTCAEATDNAH